MTNLGLSHYNFPPYGHMIKEWEDDTVTPTQPVNWGSTTQYKVWLDQMAFLFSIALWPRFDRPTQSWEGPAAAFMEALTELDFALFPEFRERIEDTLTGIPYISTQYGMFQLEDEADAKSLDGFAKTDRGPDASLRLIQTAYLKPPQIDDLVKAHMGGVRSNAGNVDLDLKVRLQRPRAYQMAWIMGKTGFSHQMAKSALTPSMISGHCFETLVGGVAAYRWAKANSLPQPAIDSLAQWTVDVGDRRVYGGVHYPSDNISSWLTGLLICPEVGITEDEIQWLWSAIKKRSYVYRVVEQANIKAGIASPYRLSMALLKAIGGREVTTLSAALATVQAPPLVLVAES